MIQLDLTKDEIAILQYVINDADHGDPLKDVYELGADKPEDPYAALRSLTRKINSIKVEAANACSRCQADITARGWTNVPDVGNLCIGCHGKWLAEQPASKPPTPKPVEFITPALLTSRMYDLADRLDQRASMVAGNSDLDDTAPDRAEPLYELAKVIRDAVESWDPK